MASEPVKPVGAEEAEPVTAQGSEPSAAPVPRKRKSRRTVPVGQIHVLASFNNTIPLVVNGYHVPVRQLAAPVALVVVILNMCRQIVM